MPDDYAFIDARTAALVTRGDLQPAQERQGALVACDRVYARIAEQNPDAHRDDVDAMTLAAAASALEALGLVPYEAVHRRTFLAVDPFTHGSRSAVEQHRADGTALCGPCCRWAEVDERARARREA
jgi:hypothetical protein